MKLKHKLEKILLIIYFYIKEWLQSINLLMKVLKWKKHSLNVLKQLKSYILNIRNRYNKDSCGKTIYLNTILKLI